jgi:hypothetical protein
MCGYQENYSNHLTQYCSKWNLKVNTKKSKILKFSGNGHKCTEKFYLNDNLPENVQKYKYLGIELSASCTFTHSEDNLVQRAQKAPFKLKACIGNEMNPKISLKLLDQLIKPILLYGSEVWGPAKPMKKSLEEYFMKSKMEHLNLSFCKYILGVNKYSNNFAARSELGRFPIGIDMISGTFSFLKHIKESTNVLLSMARDSSKEIANKGGTSWFSCILTLSKHLNLNKGTMKDKNLINQALKDKFIYFWKDKLNQIDKTSGKLSLYKQIKGNFTFEQYLTEIKNPAARSALINTEGQMINLIAKFCNECFNIKRSDNISYTSFVKVSTYLN